MTTPRRTATRFFTALALGLAALTLTACKPDAAPAKRTGIVVPEKKESDKLNAYVVANNELLKWHNFSEILRGYRQSNPTLGAKDKPALANYSIRGSDVDSAILAFDKAIVITDPLPELDEPAKALQAALNTLNPLLKEASAYENTKEYLSDKGAKARAMDGPLVAALIAANKASATFGTALSAATLKRDEAELATLKPGTLGFHKLKVSLAVRKLATTVRAALDDKQQVAGIAATLQALSAANTELGTMTRDPKAQPAWDPVCAKYKTSVDSLLGTTRALVNAMEASNGAEVNSSAKEWFDKRNKTVDAANNCGR